MNDSDRLIMSIAALRKIALSYRERIDLADSTPSMFADQILGYMGEDLEKIMQDNDRVPSMFKAFHEWRKERGE